MSKSASCDRGGRAGRALRCRKGVTALEFAIIGPIFLILVLFAMDLARYWYVAEAVRTHTAEVLRAAIVVAGADNPPAVNTCPNGSITVSATPPPGLDPASLKTQATCTRQGQQRVVTVNVSYAFSFVIPAVANFWNQNQVISDSQTTTF
ncbi:TadE/TadG family type IV pilus assembly protein [Caldovatus aquaticus]|uniref:Pilus assembly protein n=1 Tax=Caldovatus aquaticus TaxID=2865671 RepID=A0ABS7F2N0_9PROT|nr:TadE/TadG family type IV pilus assembly protein [Caldovatus aquaticus]MBW8269076.1 pilus assembly protein [Caldovatus aquaticus]